MIVTTIHRAKTNLSSLIERAERGEEIVIARGKQPVVRLVPIRKTPKSRVPGMFKGGFKPEPGFFKPLPADETAQWE